MYRYRYIIKSKKNKEQKEKEGNKRQHKENKLFDYNSRYINKRLK